MTSTSRSRPSSPSGALPPHDPTGRPHGVVRSAARAGCRRHGVSPVVRSAARAGCRRHGVSQAVSFLRSASAQASGQRRRCLRARSSSSRTSRPATKASGAVASAAIESRSHCCGHDGVLVVAEHALQPGDGLGVAPGGRDDRGRGLGRVAGPLGQDADAVQLGVGRVLAQPADPLAQVLPRPAGQLGVGLAGRPISLVEQRGRHREVDQRLGEVEVAAAVERLVERGEVGLAAGLHPVEQQATGLPVGLLLEAVDRLAQPLAQHVGVPHRPEQAAEPAQLLDQRRQGLLVEERAERPQVAAEPPRRHPGLVHALLAGVEPDDGVVEQEPPDGRRRWRPGTPPGSWRPCPRAGRRDRPAPAHEVRARGPAWARCPAHPRRPPAARRRRRR